MVMLALVRRSTGRPMRGREGGNGCTACQVSDRERSEDREGSWGVLTSLRTNWNPFVEADGTDYLKNKMKKKKETRLMKCKYTISYPSFISYIPNWMVLHTSNDFQNEIFCLYFLFYVLSTPVLLQFSEIKEGQK